MGLTNSTSRDSISSSDESFVFTPLVKEKPVITITDQVLSVTSLDYRQSPECRAEEQTGPVSIMQDVYLADESGDEEEDKMKMEERDREHLGKGVVGKGVAVKAWPDRDQEEAEKRQHRSEEDRDERSSGTRSSSSGGSTSSGSVPEEKLHQDIVGSDTDMEEPGLFCF